MQLAKLTNREAWVSDSTAGELKSQILVMKVCHLQRCSCAAGLQRFARSDGDSSAGSQAGPVTFKASAHAAAMMELNMIINGLQSLQTVRSCLFNCITPSHTLLAWGSEP